MDTKPTAREVRKDIIMKDCSVLYLNQKKSNSSTFGRVRVMKGKETKFVVLPAHTHWDFNGQVGASQGFCQLKRRTI